MDKKKHSDHFGEGLLVGILIGHYVKPYETPLWMKIVFGLLVLGFLILWIYLRRDGKKYKKKSDK